MSDATDLDALVERLRVAAEKQPAKLREAVMYMTEHKYSPVEGCGCGYCFEHSHFARTKRNERDIPNVHKLENSR